MTHAIIDLNDAAMAIGQDGQVLHTSAGYALLDQQKLMVGLDAQGATKLLPRWTNNRFWNQLNTDGISNATTSVRHHADLAFAHLETLKVHTGDEPVVLAVPAFYDKGQLGLLLGMAKEAGLNVGSLVDAALLAVAGQASHANALFLDVGLHRVTLTSLRTDGALRVTGQQTVLETGLATYWDRWASLVAEQFIQSSRFDPMHEAASEQKLFDQIPAFIANSGTERTLSFELDLGHTKHNTVMSRDQLMGVTAPAYPTIVQAVRQMAEDGTQTSLFVSSRIQAFPELVNSLRLIPNIDVTCLTSNQVVQSAHLHWDKLGTTTDTVPHITTLGLSADTPASAASAKQNHFLLVGHKLYSLNQSRAIAGFTSGALVEDQQNPACRIHADDSGLLITPVEDRVLVNGSKLQGPVALSAGDQIDIAGQTALVVTEG